MVVVVGRGNESVTCASPLSPLHDLYPADSGNIQTSSIWVEPQGAGKSRVPDMKLWAGLKARSDGRGA